jgi:hypothetical protein
MHTSIAYCKVRRMGPTGNEVAAALPDGDFLRQIWKILSDFKVVWRAKNISGGLPISGGFLADLINLALVCFCLAVLESLLAKKQLFLTFYCIIKMVDKKLFCTKYLQKRKMLCKIFI